MGVAAAIGGFVDAIGSAFAGLGAGGLAAGVGADVGAAGLGADALGAGAGITAADSALWSAVTPEALAANAGALGAGDLAATGAGLGAGDIAGGAGLGAAADTLGIGSGGLTAGAGDLATTGAAGITGAAPTASALGTAPLATAGPSAASIAAPAGAGPADLTSALGAGSSLAPQDAASLSSQLGLGASGGTSNAGIAIGDPASAVANPELGGATGFSPGGPIEGPPGPIAQAGVNGAGGIGATGGGGQSALGQIGSGLSTGWNDVVGALSSPTAKALGVGVAGLGLARDIFGQNSPPKNVNAVQGLASQAGTQGQILQSYLETGTLPPAIQASVNAATQAGITAIKSKYAGMGVAPGSSGEVQDIASLQQQAVYQGANLADQLLQQGISETQLSGTLYQALISNQNALNSQTTSAIGGLASALAGSPRIQIGGTSTF